SWPSPNCSEPELTAKWICTFCGGCAAATGTAICSNAMSTMACFIAISGTNHCFRDAPTGADHDAVALELELAVEEPADCLRINPVFLLEHARSETLHVIARQDRHRGLHDNGTMVEFRSDEMNRATMDSDAFL